MNLCCKYCWLPLKRFREVPAQVSESQHYHGQVLSAQHFTFRSVLYILMTTKVPCTLCNSQARSVTPLHFPKFSWLINSLISHLNKVVAQIQVVLRQRHEQKGFYSTYFLVHKKDSGFHPIVDLRGANWLLKTWLLRLYDVFHPVSPLDWFTYCR